MDYQSWLDKFDYSEASLDRIDVCIDTMKAVDEWRFSMSTWQKVTDYDICKTVTELHACGSTACFGGYLALNPEFQAAGGSVSDCGSPRFGSLIDGFSGGGAFDRYIGVPQRRGTAEESLGGLMMGTDTSTIVYGLSTTTPIDVIERLQYIRELIVLGHKGETA